MRVKYLFVYVDIDFSFIYLDLCYSHLKRLVMESGMLFRAFIIGSLVQYKVLLLMSNKVINNLDAHREFLNQNNVSKNWMVDETINLKEQYNKLRGLIVENEGLSEDTIDRCIEFIISGHQYKNVLTTYKTFCDRANMVLHESCDSDGILDVSEYCEDDIKLLEGVMDELNCLFDVFITSMSSSAS